MMFEFVSPEPKNEVKTKTKIYEKSPYDYRMNLKEGDLVYFLTETIESAKIKAVTGKIHGFGRGWCLGLLLDDDRTVFSWDCFSCPEDICEILIERIASDERQAERSKNFNPDAALNFPKINKIIPTSITDEIVSVQPMLDKNSQLFNG